MASEVIMPKLGPAMEEGTILQWFKEEGDAVSKGDMLFEVMTDKVNIEVEAEASGILLKKLYGVDEIAPVNQPIAFIGEEGESVETSTDNEVEAVTEDEDPAEDISSDTTNETEQLNETGKVRATPAARKLARDNEIDLQNIHGSGPRNRVQLDDVKEYLSSNQIKVTPLAKKIAEKESIDPEDIKGTGAHGKVMSKDVYKHLDKGVQAESSSVDFVEKIPVEGIRKVVSERMSESAFTAPHATISTEIDMTATKEMRENLLPIIEQETGYRLSYTEIILKAVAMTLKNHPIMNASLEDDHIVLHSNVNIGLAVAVPDGLLVPVVHDCTDKGLSDLTKECKTLGKLARENKLNLDQMSGGTFTISNLGMYAVDTFTPIINQPESAILGVGRIVEKPVGVDGEIKLRPMMSLSLSFDHRIIDGAPAATFLTELKETIENPLTMLV